MKILGIETSCDETACAVVEDGNGVLSSVVASSSEMHAKTGGIIPEEAARQQIKSIIPVIEEAIGRAKYKPEDIEVVAVTAGPGLIGSLLVGVETAKTLALLWEKPIVGVNHLVGHVYACWLECEEPKFPALALVVSGGHTDLVLMKDHGLVELVGTTRDDAAGECFDKSARLLGLGYPGGPAIAASADKFEARNAKFEKKLLPRPMIGSDDFDWSFSGLKTALLNKTKERKLTRKDVEHMAAEVQAAIVDVLVAKSMMAVKKYSPASFLLCGGVAANEVLRESFGHEFQLQAPRIRLHVPEPKYCTDNAAMIAAAAFYNYRPVSWKVIKANPSLGIEESLV